MELGVMHKATSDRRSAAVGADDPVLPKEKIPRLRSGWQKCCHSEARRRI